MDEYASMRFTLRCGSASRLPTTIVSSASVREQRRAAAAGPRPCASATNTRTSAANAAAFTPALISAVTGVGAPSYTSGVHMWNGTAATLNAKPGADQQQRRT